ncbi:uncharacterized protein LOC123679181 [Harmonia axyridis]|uniref:uncharacterized protein LOC123679181 n=1 Tax=Harmonia axyridis TaxID=115357 RepID=UPI001E275058|nr:uncharacterized protein LOC123679181 [Harmonia axyridis]
MNDDQYQKMREGTFRGHMIEMANWGGKTEAIRLTQSRIGSIVAKEMTSNSRRECKNLNNLLMDIASNKVFYNDGLASDRMFQSNETLNVRNTRIRKPSTSQTTTEKLSNFLSILKDSLELVNSIGKKQALKQLQLQIDDTPKNGGKTTNQKINQLRKVMHIIKTEGNSNIQNKNKKTKASIEHQQNLVTRRTKKTKAPQNQQNILPKRGKETQASNPPTQEQNTRRKRKRGKETRASNPPTQEQNTRRKRKRLTMRMPRTTIKKEFLSKKEREKNMNSNVHINRGVVNSHNITALKYPVKKEKTEEFSNVRVKQEVIEID